MESINQWLDLDELNKLATALLEPTEETGKSEQLDIPRAASVALAEASKMAKRAGVIEEAGAEVKAQLAEVAAWLLANAPSRGACVVDATGKVLHDAMPSRAWTQLALSMAVDTAGDVRLKVSGGGYLQLIAVKVGERRALVGLLTTVLLVEDKVEAFRGLLERVLG